MQQLCIKVTRAKSRDDTEPGPFQMTERRFLKPALLVVMAAACAACTRVPEIEDRLTTDMRDAAYPALLPLDDGLPTLPTPQDQSAELEEQLEARSARLKARAEALRRATN